MKRTPLKRKTSLRAKKPWRRKVHRQTTPHDFVEHLSENPKRGDQYVWHDGGRVTVVRVDGSMTAVQTPSGSIVQVPTGMLRPDALVKAIRLRPRRKNKPAKSAACKAYLAWLHEQACYPHQLWFGTTHRCEHAHHQRTGYGMGQKAPDWRAIPMCLQTHVEFHDTLGAKKWAEKYGMTELEMVEAFRAEPETQAKLKELGLDFNLETSAIGRHDPKYAEQVSKGVAEDQGEDQE